MFSREFTLLIKKISYLWTKTDDINFDLYSVSSYTKKAFKYKTEDIQCAGEKM